MSDKCWSFVVDFPINILDSFNHHTHKLLKIKLFHCFVLASTPRRRIFVMRIYLGIWGIENLYFKRSGFKADLFCHYVKSMESIIRFKCINWWILIPSGKYLYQSKFLSLQFYLCNINKKFLKINLSTVLEASLACK